MARIRTIKPEFFTSEQIVECSSSARLQFVGLLVFSDDGGVHPASAKRLKMEVWPGDDVSISQIEQWNEELMQAGLVGTFTCSKGESYWYVTGWSKHQKIDRPTYRFPRPFDEGSTITRGALDEDSRRSLMESNGDETKGDEGSVKDGRRVNARELTPEKAEEIKAEVRAAVLPPHLQSTEAKMAFWEYLCHAWKREVRCPGSYPTDPRQAISAAARLFSDLQTLQDSVAMIISNDWKVLKVYENRRPKALNDVPQRKDYIPQRCSRD